MKINGKRDSREKKDKYGMEGDNLELVFDITSGM